MEKEYTKMILIICCLVLLNNRIYSQDVESSYQSLKERLQSNPLTYSGMLMSEGQYYRAAGIDNRAIPFIGRIGGNLQLDFMGVSVPISLFIGSGGTVFNTDLPAFAFVGLSPKYKNLTLHLGTRTLDLGRYSFSNHSFEGLGVEYKPNRWRLCGFFGRLRRSRPQDVLGIQRIDPVFRRLGAGIKVGYEKDKDIIAMSIFKGWDDPNSLSLNVDSSLVLPAQNVIYSLESQKNISNSLLIKFNYSISGITENTMLPNIRSIGWVSSMGGLLEINPSTRWNHAFDTGLQLNMKNGSIQIEYQKVDPGYRTLGALFFQNDLENISLGIKQRWWRNRIQINGRGGVQRNNLAGNQVNTYQRLVAALMLGITPVDPLNIQVSYSSFNNVNIRAGVQDINTPLLVTELVLNNEDINGSLNYMTHRNDRTIGSFQFGYQFSSGFMIENDAVQEDADTKAQNLSFHYNLQWIPRKMTFYMSAGRQLLQFGAQSTLSKFIGGSIQYQFGRDKMSFGLTFNTDWNTQGSQEGEKLNGIIQQIGWSFQYKVTENISLSHTTSYVQNTTQGAMIDSSFFNEWRSRIQFVHTF
jgi:hypothetical protein